MADYYDTHKIPPPAGATKIADPKALSGLKEDQIWRQPGTTNIYQLATAPLSPLPMQPGEANAQNAMFTQGGYSANDAMKKTIEMNANRPPVPAGSGTPPASLTLAPTGQQFSTAAPTQTPPTAAPQGPAGSQSAFGMAFGQLMAMGQKNQGLQDQKNKLIQQLYDRPLTPEELRTLSPAQQEAISSGDKKLLEFQILTINDMIKGRADENTSALKYMMDGYKLDQAEVEKKRSQAFTSFTSIIEKYPDIAAGLSEEGFAAIQSGEMPPAEDIQKVYAAYKDSLAADKLKATAEDSKQPAIVQEYEYAKDNGYEGTFLEYQKDTKAGSAASTDTSAIKEYEYAKEQGFDGSFMDFTTSKKPLTEAQSKDLTYGTRANEADGYLVTLTDKTVAMSPITFSVMFAAEETTIGNAIVSDDFRQMRQAERNFATAALRRESGAAISAGEFKTLEKQYFPRPGDDEQTVKQKAQNRRTFVDSLNSTNQSNLGGGTSGKMTPEQQAKFDTFRNDPAYEGLNDDEIKGALGFSKVGSVTVNAQSDSQKASQLAAIPTDVKWGTGTSRTTSIGQCGALVNDITGLGMRDSIKSKVAVCDPALLKSKDVAVGDVFVQSVKNDPGGHGHTGIINSVGQDSKGKFAIVTEANYHLNGQTTHDRKIYLNDPAIKGFAKPKSWNLA